MQVGENRTICSSSRAHREAATARKCFLSSSLRNRGPTLEDEDGLVNVVVWRDLGERQRRVLLEARLLAVQGRVESAEGVQHLIAADLRDWTPLLGGLATQSRDFR